MALRVLHLIGSPVDDFFVNLSRVYAEDCLEATYDPLLYDTQLAVVSPDGLWRFPIDLSRTALGAAAPLSVGAAITHLSTLDVDVAVPQMFCLPGMTTFRAVLDLVGIPFVGNTADVMALGAHKARARAIVAAAGVRVPDAEVIRIGQSTSLTPPLVVKPVSADNSIGVALVRRASELPAALSTAFEYDDEVLLEKYVELGREVRCGVLDRDGELVCLPLEEYAVPAQIRTAADKLKRTEVSIDLVAKNESRAWIIDTTDEVTERVWAAARSSYRAMGCRDYGLFDFRIDPSGEPWFLEAGLYCSFAEQSVIPTMARAAGIPLRKLFAAALAQAIDR